MKSGGWNAHAHGARRLVRCLQRSQDVCCIGCRRQSGHWLRQARQNALCVVQDLDAVAVFRDNLARRIAELGRRPEPGSQGCPVIIFNGADRLQRRC